MFDYVKADFRLFPESKLIVPPPQKNQESNKMQFHNLHREKMFQIFEWEQNAIKRHDTIV